jgi:hypothetical protein
VPHPETKSLFSYMDVLIGLHLASPGSFFKLLLCLRIGFFMLWTEAET